MPKVPNHELGRYLDPESEEYSPAKGDLEDEAKTAAMIGRELFDISDELNHPKRDSETGEEDKFIARDPEYFSERLFYLRENLSKIKDRKLQKELKENFSKLEQRVYKQFIPFIEARINFFGWQNSPLEKKYDWGGRKIDQDFAEYFTQARAALKQLKLPEEESVDYLNNLNWLEEKLDRYRSELTLYTFEKIEEELQKELYDYRRITQVAKGLEDVNAQKETVLKFDLLLAKAHSLLEISSRMLHKEIRSNCAARAQSLLDHVEYLKALNEAPRELSATEGELKDLWQRIKNGEQVGAVQLDSIFEKLVDLKARRLDSDTRKIIDKLIKTAEKLKRALAGENIDEEEDRFEANTGNVDWAWTILGIEKNSSQQDLKQAYHKLALKYHPDSNIDKGAAERKKAEEIMKKINQAVDFIRRVRGYK